MLFFSNFVTLTARLERLAIHSVGQSQRMCRITKEGRRDLRQVMVKAAHRAVHRYVSTRLKTLVVDGGSEVQSPMDDTG
ncbi:MAG: transposase [Candidatus Promineifilaceae bacterium]